MLDHLLDDLIGCDSVAEELRELRRTVEFAERRGEDAKKAVSFAYLFLGNPGTLYLCV
jgi:hypothetical protein